MFRVAVNLRKLFLFGFLILNILSITLEAGQLTKNNDSLHGNIEVSLFPVHKASLLGLTSTENPTLGLGFFGKYNKVSFYVTTFHEYKPNLLILSQSEVNLNYKCIDNESFLCNIFNTAVSRSKDTTLFMIPTVSLGLFKTKSLKIDLTPYTWGFHSQVKGYTYALSYDYSKLINKISVGLYSKCIYTKIDPVYNGIMVEFSPRIKFKNSLIQSGLIYQLSSHTFVYDVCIKQSISFGKKQTKINRL
jgi:hypothetical protein